MVRAMFPVPMKLILLMRCALFLVLELVSARSACRFAVAVSRNV
jgi:hypothetical protein